MLCIIAGHFGIVSAGRFVFTFHVPLFFLLSGYFLSTKGDCGGNIGPNSSYAARPKSLRYCMGLL